MSPLSVSVCHSTNASVRNIAPPCNSFRVNRLFLPICAWARRVSARLPPQACVPCQSCSSAWSCRMTLIDRGSLLWFSTPRPASVRLTRETINERIPWTIYYEPCCILAADTIGLLASFVRFVRAYTRKHYAIMFLVTNANSILISERVSERDRDKEDILDSVV